MKYQENPNTKQIGWFWVLSSAIKALNDQKAKVAELNKPPQPHIRKMISCGSIGFGLFDDRRYQPLK